MFESFESKLVAVLFLLYASIGVFAFTVIRTAPRNSGGGIKRD